MHFDTDIAILGAGPTGLALALALRDGPWRVTLFDGTTTRATDPRALALSEGTRQLLDRLGAWPDAASSVTAIRQINISQQGGTAGTDLRAESLGVPTLGHVVRYGDLVDALRTRTTSAGSTLVADCYASRIECDRNGVLVHFDNADSVRARLVVHAEGAHDETSWQHDYHQTAIVCEATPTLPHHHLAYERFTPDGPLALLPLEDKYAVVRVVAHQRRAELLALSEADFAADLQQTLGHRVAFSAVGTRSAFPLNLKIRPRLHHSREVWIGNAAQTLHPVSGQGFNLGLRDAWTLAEALFDAVDNNLSHRDSLRSQKKQPHAALPPEDPFAGPVLAAWARSRRLDRLATTAFTDGIVRIFSNDVAPLHQARELGLQVLDLLPGLRNFVARRMIWGARGW